MKSFCLLFVAGLVTATLPGPESAGQTFLLEPSARSWRSQRQWRSMPRVFRNTMSGVTTSKLVRSLQVPQTRLVRTMPIPQTRIVRAFDLQGKIFRNELSGAATQKIVRSLAPQGVKEYVKTKQFTEQRHLRAPLAKTVTKLPDEVTRITRNMKTHMPMVHERIRNHYSVEDVNKKNFVHHYITPVRNERLGTRKGRSARLGTEHVLHNRMYNPLRFATEQKGYDISDRSAGDEFVDVNTGVVAGSYWKVLEAESCEGVAAGQSVRPKAVCVCNGVICDKIDSCNQFPYPEDIIC